MVRRECHYFEKWALVENPKPVNDVRHEDSRYASIFVWPLEYQ